jgi:hypothetical protein
MVGGCDASSVILQWTLKQGKFRAALLHGTSLNERRKIDSLKIFTGAGLIPETVKKNHNPTDKHTPSTKKL